MSNQRGVLLGIGGYAGAGKDALADFLVQNNGWKSTFMSKPVHEALLRINPDVPQTVGISMPLAVPVRREGQMDRPKQAILYERYSELVERVGYTRAKDNRDVRRMLQKMGTEVGREMFGENCWVNLMLREVEPWLEEGYHVAVTGIRYENEMSTVERSAAGWCTWVDRPGVEPVNAHTSDNSLSRDDFGWIVNNGGTLDDLANHAEQIHRDAQHHQSLGEN